jgi:hypothetical protein
MGIFANAVVLSEEAAAEHASTSPYLFGAAALVVLTALMIVTLMLKVGD